jgi:hypothetical protein
MGKKSKRITKLKVGDLAEIKAKRFHYLTDDESEGKVVVITKLIDSSESGHLIECFIDNQFVIFPEYVLRRIS